jgi:transposase-like protein
MQNTKHMPRAVVEDAFAADRLCPICESQTLAVTHLEDLPDYVGCSTCGSAFVLDALTETALYGSISADYPETRDFALKRWVDLEAVRIKAAAERTPTGLQSATPPFGIPESTGEQLDAEATPSPPTDPGPEPDTEAPPRQPSAVDLPESMPAATDEGPIEPEPGLRYRVIVADTEPIMPSDHCAHCYRAAAPRRIEISGDYEGAVPFQTPLCQDCYRRSTAKTEEERTAGLIAHLSAALIAAVLIVLALASGLIDLRGSLLVALLLTVILGALGYGIPARILLSRQRGYPAPADSLYVRSTMLVQPRPDSGKLAFSWRNARYAERFRDVNPETAEQQVTKVFESGRLPEQGTG